MKFGKFVMSLFGVSQKPVNTDPLVQFLVKRVGGQRRKVGVLMARIDGAGYVRLGWSRANFKAGDEFDKRTALKIAHDRTTGEFTPICHSFRRDMTNFRERCQRYYKNAVAMDEIVVAPQTKKPVDA